LLNKYDFFTHNYDFKQWFIKLKTYELILENTDKFFESFADEELKKEGLEPYKLKLKADVCIKLPLRILF